LADLADRQCQALHGAAPLVKPEGRLVYATCSVLADENEQRVEEFLATHPDFTPLPITDAWSTAGLAAPCPGSGHGLRLSPAATGTDGFFVAVLMRKGS
jgi:16S rRNA (cytosine967-C5)-methyltransferase